MKEYVKNMKEYVKNMTEYVENMKEYVKNMKKLYRPWDSEKFRIFPLYMGLGTWKNFTPSFLLGSGT